jgi:asparagine synthase (glutamine-hydrolysing)
VRWWLRDHGLSWVPIDIAHPYADYKTWMRTTLRAWIESVLLSPQALGRGILQEAYVRNLLAEHMAGCDHTRQLGVLVSLELWHQQFID